MENREGVNGMKICVCGSLMYANGLVEVAKMLEALGHEVILPRCVREYVMRGGYMETDSAVIYGQGELVRQADALVVCNFLKDCVPGYIGASTYGQMYLAETLEKPIYAVFPLPEMPYIRDELSAMHIAVLDGDLRRIPGGVEQGRLPLEENSNSNEVSALDVDVKTGAEEVVETSQGVAGASQEVTEANQATTDAGKELDEGATEVEFVVTLPKMEIVTSEAKAESAEVEPAQTEAKPEVAAPQLVTPTVNVAEMPLPPKEVVLPEAGMPRPDWAENSTLPKVAPLKAEEEARNAEAAMAEKKPEGALGFLRQARDAWFDRFRKAKN